MTVWGATIGFAIVLLFGITMIVFGAFCVQARYNEGTHNIICAVGDFGGGVAMLAIGVLWVLLALAPCILSIAKGLN
jgi:hypothetical protein